MSNTPNAQPLSPGVVQLVSGAMLASPLVYLVLIALLPRVGFVPGAGSDVDWERLYAGFLVPSLVFSAAAPKIC